MPKTFTFMANGGVDRRLTFELMREMRRILYQETGMMPSSIRAGQPVREAYGRLFTPSQYGDIQFTGYSYDRIPMLRDDTIGHGTMEWFLRDRDGTDERIGRISDIDVLDDKVMVTIDRIEVRSADPDAVIFEALRRLRKAMPIRSSAKRIVSLRARKYGAAYDHESDWGAFPASDISELKVVCTYYDLSDKKFTDWLVNDVGMKLSGSAKVTIEIVNEPKS